jgi:hypothetical protein
LLQSSALTGDPEVVAAEAGEQAVHAAPFLERHAAARGIPPGGGEAD